MTSTTSPAEARTQEYEFEEMNLQVGGRIQFITHRTIKPIQHFSTIIGWVKDEYLIVRIPLENGAPVAVNEGDKLTIRVFSGVNVCSFPAIVQRVFGRPLFYVHLSFPDQIQGTSLRTAMRVRVDIPAEVSCEQTGKVPVSLLNLSVSGALLETGRKLPPDESRVGIAFSLLAPPDNRRVPIQTQALVRNVNLARPANEEREVFTYGVQFVDLAPEHFTLLQNLTYEALIADRQKIV
ncbi:flagellar brake protein [Pseudoduganella namucuonensis]|uniref:C-di-GMP-binding flagellar brake protein YcgR, contains PilZNR and PilZ domains n=1 Tax=Pseudoduganella namucuonensis TaxID=1035707 RepID=A0A1I7KK91_9BURK|nr:flagellar brake protein [Pseudoduganella namucuonensis]SFU97831.1 c-di-GMP-binding flagellar brake protein YcgR, contains PilZNR and PilZ domains [Pseudoduganella namucuonensis]